MSNGPPRQSGQSTGIRVSIVRVNECSQDLPAEERGASKSYSYNLTLTLLFRTEASARSLGLFWFQSSDGILRFWRRTGHRTSHSNRSRSGEASFIRACCPRFVRLVVLPMLYLETAGTDTDLRAVWASAAARGRRIRTAEEISRKAPSMAKNDTTRLAGVPR
jgi:hypothetical protein